MLRVFVLSLALTTFAVQEPHHTSGPLRLRYGVAAFGDVDPLKSLETLRSLGFDYAEPALSKTLALDPAALAAARAKIAQTGIHVETMNWFLPGSDIPLTGPKVDPAKIREYV